MMHKTKTGRWQPDKPKPQTSEAPDPAAVHDQSYEMYTIHRYSHALCDTHPTCPWCANCAICLGLNQSNPFAVLSEIRWP